MLNQVIQMGRLTADPELKQTASGVSFVNFSIAVERNYVGEGGRRETDFFDCIAWRNTAEFISRNFSKGRLITIVGSLETQRWEDEAGNKRSAVKIKAEQAYFCGDFGERREQQPPSIPREPAQRAADVVPPSQRGQAQQTQMPYNPYAAAPTAPPQPPYSDDDLPF